MSFLTGLINATTEKVENSILLAEIATWMEKFKNFFGSAIREEFQQGDEAFYNLVRLGQHSKIAEKAIELPMAFCRGNILSAFFLGESVEKMPGEDGKKETKIHHYPRPSKDVALMVAEAVSPLLFTRLEQIATSQPQGVGRAFWVTNPEYTSYDKNLTGGQVAQEASAIMHCIINVVEGAVPEDRQAVKKMFLRMFDNLPAGVYKRMLDWGDVMPTQAPLISDNNKKVGRQGASKPDNGNEGGKPTLKPGKAARKKGSENTDPMKQFKQTPAEAKQAAEYMAEQARISAENAQNGHAGPMSKAIAAAVQQ